MTVSGHLNAFSPIGRPIEDVLAPRPRRQHLPGFDAVYSDIVDYILRCTHRIWEEKNVGLCRSHYGADCLIHTLAGETRGADAVIANTLATLAAFPDRTLIGEDVIWSEDAPGRFHTSHRIVSLMTHLGDDDFGPATGRRAQVTTIADCICVENRIVEEWLVRDNLWLVKQLGLDGRSVAQAQAARDQAGDPVRHAWRWEEIARVRDGQGLASPLDPEHPALPFAAMLERAVNDQMLGDAAAHLSAGIEGFWPSGRRWIGRGGWVGAFSQLLGVLDQPRLVIDHLAATPSPQADTAVAIRWSLAGRHARSGVYGEPSGRDLLILGVSHYRVRAGLITEDQTVFDELAVLRQVVGGLGA